MSKMKELGILITEVQEVIPAGNLIIISRKREVFISNGYATIVVVVWTIVFICIGGLLETIIVG